MTATNVIVGLCAFSFGVLVMGILNAASHADDIMRDLDQYDRGVLDGMRRSLTDEERRL